MQTITGSDADFLGKAQLTFVKCITGTNNWEYKIENSDDDFDMNLRDAVDVASILQLKDGEYVYAYDYVNDSCYVIKREYEGIVLDVWDNALEEIKDEKGYLLLGEDFEEYLAS